jgi:hypothetical protein
MAITIDGKKRNVKTKAARGPISNSEPKWEGANEWSGEQFNRTKHYAFEYYRMESKSAQYKKWVMSWVNEDTNWKKHGKSIAKHSDSRFIPTLGAVCRMLTLGMPIEHKAYKDYWESLPGTSGDLTSPLDFINKKLEELLVSSENVFEEIKETKKEKAQTPTIQDRMNEIANKHILHFELFEDQLMNGETVNDPKAFEYLKTENCPQALIKKISAFFEVHRQELIEAKAGQDEQLKEGYSHYKAADYKRFEAFYAKLFADLEAYAQVKKATKQARVRKAPAKEKVVAKLKYLKEDSKSKLVSVNPVDILTAETLWVYNTKTRKLGKYIADAHAGTLGVKGTSIVGFDETQSVQKTLRKPEQQLKDFKGAGKIQLRKFIESIKTTDTKLNGRINADTILLKVI